MKNLKNLNVVELNAQEVSTVEGGFVLKIYAAAGVAAAYLSACGLTVSLWAS